MQLNTMQVWKQYSPTEKSTSFLLPDRKTQDYVWLLSFVHHTVTTKRLNEEKCFRLRVHQHKD